MSGPGLSLQVTHGVEKSRKSKEDGQTAPLITITEKNGRERNEKEERTEGEGNGER